MTATDRGLAHAISSAMPVYEIPEDDLVGDVLVRGMAHSSVARISAGFFSSHCLAQIAPGLASFIARTSGTLELLISPEISDEDRDAIDRGLREPEAVLDEALGRLLDDGYLSSSMLVRHTLDCLSFLVASDRLEVRIVLMQKGMYHKKIWLFSDGIDWLAVHGSGNATARGLLVNGEQMTVDRPWMDGSSSAQRVALLVTQWDKQWHNRNRHSLTVKASSGLRFAGRRGDASDVPTVRDFWAAWQEDHAAGLEPELPHGFGRATTHVLSVPDDMLWREGRYSHQGRAVEALLAHGGRGVLEIATGGGKTKTALITATQIQDNRPGPVLVVILAPSKPLLRQWADEVREFGVEPLVLAKWDSTNRCRVLEELVVGMATDLPRTEVIVCSNRLFAEDQRIRAMLDNLDASVTTILIGDEMHNLGVSSFLDDPPERFDSRIGLSATPVRQYDPDGTDRLFGFFGDPVFEFSLQEAIESGCLTPYRYHLHEVRLTDEELDKYAELTEELNASGFRRDDDGRTLVSNPKVDRLLRQRRAVLEQAEGKISLLRELLVASMPQNVSKTLIYTSAKEAVVVPARQIELVNELLSDLGIISHQFTSAETSRVDAQLILERFGMGDYQVLTAMKVLDEGVDIPQTDTAYLLASSTVTREWVQRRGRILRRSQGKTTADLHDFLVVPPDTSSKESKSIIRGELRRAEEFARLAANEWVTGGPRSLISQYD